MADYETLHVCRVPDANNVSNFGGEGGGCSKSHTFKWLVKVGASKGLTPDL